MVLLWIGVTIAAIIWGISKLRHHQQHQRQQLEAQEAQRKAQEEEQARIVARWKTVIDRHEAMRRNVLHAETDWDMLFDLPALTDIKVRATRRLYHAMRDAENAIPDMPAIQLLGLNQPVSGERKQIRTTTLVGTSCLLRGTLR